MNRQLGVLAIALFAVACFVSAGCSSGGVTPQGSGGAVTTGHRNHHRQLQPATGPSPYIKHVVIIVQENRTFNTIFGGPNPFPNASTQPYGYEHDGTQVNLSKVEFEDQTCDIEHYIQDAWAALNENTAQMYQMNGFDQEKMTCGGNAKKFPYKYVDYTETKPYWFMASHWALGDHFYPTELGPSFTAHLNLIAGTDEISPGHAAVNFPSSWGGTNEGCESPAHSTTPILKKDGSINVSGPYPCFYEYHTMPDLLKVSNVTQNLTWRYYAPTVSDEGGRVWSEFDAIEQIRCGTSGPINKPCPGTGPEWANVVTPAHKILSDINSGFLASISWVVPTWANSDHQGCYVTNGTCSGPAWVASIVNAVGKSSFWNSTVIVVLWDDWGGWYDEVAPPQYDFRGKGIRTPVIVISPYTKSSNYYYYYGGNGWVSHYEYEPGSILKFIEQAFNLPTLASLSCSYYYYYYYDNCQHLGYTDSTAKHGIGDGTLDFTQTPRPFTPVPTPKGYDQNYFSNQPESAGAPDNE